MGPFPLRRLWVLVAILLSVSACTTNPYTGRWQLHLVPASKERSMGAQAFEEILSDPSTKASRDPREVQPVERVATRVIEAAKRSEYAEAAKQFNWEVVVIKDDRTQNAFALPGGKLAVYTGIFPVAQTEAGLAAIIGHEVTHALARHGGERMSHGVLAQAAVIGATLGAASQGVNPRLAQLAGGALANYGFVLPYSRKHESEADYIGLLLAADAGYDPREAVRVWERMEQMSQNQPLEFLSTHPSHGTRIKQLQQWMPEALALYKESEEPSTTALPSISSSPHSLQQDGDGRERERVGSLDRLADPIPDR